MLALGLVSLLTDVSSEMIFPLLPAFLSARVPAAPLLIGAMEGAADLVAAACKLWAGRWSDRSAKLRPLVVAGYSVSTAMRPLWAAVGAWWQPLLIRVADRVGKGLRGPPRDAMIASWVPPGARARAFGYHRAMDHAGAALGALLASALLAWGASVERVFLLSAIPGALAVMAIFLAREPERPAPPPKEEALARVPARLYFYLGPVALFALANATDAFLLLRLAEQGAPPELLPLAWLSLNVVKAAVSLPAGSLADRVGASRVVPAAWTLHALAYAGLAFSPSAPATFALIAAYGLYHALSEGAEKALLADLAPAESRGRAFGLYHSLSGVGTLVAGLVFGALWYFWTSKVAFVAAAAVAVAGAASLLVLLPSAQAEEKSGEKGSFR